MEAPDWSSGVSRCTGGALFISRLENQLQHNNVHGEIEDGNEIKRTRTMLFNDDENNSYATKTSEFSE